MTDTDRTLLVLAFALIVFTYYACVLVLEGLKELQSAIRRWRVRHEIAAVGRLHIPRRQDLPQSGNGR